MITFGRKIKWFDKLFIAKYEKAIKTAVQKSAIVVKREAKQLLNVSGKSATAKSGLNSLSSKEKKGLSTTEQNDLIKSKGINSISGLKTVSNKAGNSLTFDGKFSYTDKKTKQQIKLTRIYWYGSPLNRWVQSSEAGAPPHKQSGNLQKVVIEPVNGGMSAKVGPQYGLKYARIQELGGRGLINLPARPYMAPAIQAKAFEIHIIFKKELWKAV